MRKGARLRVGGRNSVGVSGGRPVSIPSNGPDQRAQQGLRLSAFGVGVGAAP